MGLGNAPDWRDEYEWVDLARYEPPVALPATSRGPRTPRPPAGPRSGAFPVATRDAVWGAGQGGPKILLVDLDNLRGRPRVWRERMEAIVSLAEGADRVYLAGQGASVALACPHLGDYAKWAVRVPMGPDAADKYLLEQAGKVSRRKGARPHFVIASNDFLFARLGRQGRLSVVSPEASLVSKRLAASAAAVYAFAA